MSGHGDQSSMNRFGEFAQKFRSDHDAYTVGPGNAWFRGCDARKATLVCPMTKL